MFTWKDIIPCALGYDVTNSSTLKSDHLVEQQLSGGHNSDPHIIALEVSWVWSDLIWVRVMVGLGTRVIK